MCPFLNAPLYSLTFMYSYIMRGAVGGRGEGACYISIARWLTSLVWFFIAQAHWDNNPRCSIRMHDPESQFLLINLNRVWIMLLDPSQNRTSCWYTPCLLRIQADLKANIIACIARSILAYFVLFTSNSIFTSKKQNILFSVLINVEGNIWKGCKHGYLFRHRESVYNFLW